MSHSNNPPESGLDWDPTLLRLASRTARLGGWRVELDPRRIIWAPETAAIHEVPPGATPDFDEAINYYAPAYRDRILQLFNECATEGTSFDEVLQIITARGNHVWVRSIGEADRDENDRIIAVQGAFQDITEQMESRKRSEDLSRRLQQTLEGMSDAFFLLDHDWIFRFLNSQAERVLGRSAAELLGKNVWDEFPDAVGSDFQRQYERAMYSNATVRFTEYYPEPLEAWFEVNAYPGPDGLAVYFRDVTERRIIEDKLARSERLNAIGELTGGVAHDFNNLLTVILGNAELLVERLDQQQHDLRPLAEMTAKAASRGAELTNRLLAFARRQPLEPRSVNINRLVTDMDGLLRRTLGMNVVIDVIPDPDLWMTEIDPGQLEVALLNLAINARDAMTDGGRLTIETANTELDEEYARLHEEVTPGEYVVVSVSDTGSGMPPSVVDKAFEPFFTTKETGKGSGLGLSMVYGFLKQSGGHARIYSEPGDGTSIRLYFPRNEEAHGRPYETPDRELAPGGTEHILVVEDDPLVRKHLVSQLMGFGYQVTDTDDGQSAMSIIRDTDDIDLLFTDVVMPGGMNGRQLAESALALRPELKVLYTSGYAENALVHHGRLDQDVHLLSKPYRRSDLALKVRKALEGR